MDRLVRDQFGDVCVLDNFSRGRIEHLAHNSNAIRIVDGDILDTARLRAEMAGTEVVFHLAALSSVFDCVHNPAAAIRTNVEGTRQILEAASQAGVRRVVVSSSREVYGEPAKLPVPESSPINPKNAYGASKVAAEEVCAEYAAGGLELIVFRLSNVYGIRDRGRVIRCSSSGLSARSHLPYMARTSCLIWFGSRALLESWPSQPNIPARLIR